MSRVGRPPKYAPDEPRPCPRCTRTLPPDAFNAKTRDPDGTPRSRQTLCKTCAQDRRRERAGITARDPVAQADIIRNRRRRQKRAYHRMMADPQRAAAFRRKRHAYWLRRKRQAQTDAKLARKMADAARRYEQGITADPERRIERAIDERIRRHSQHGGAAFLVSTALAAYEDRTFQDWVDPEPFLAFLDASFPGASTDVLADVLAIEPSRIDEFRSQSRISFSVVDALLTRSLGRPDLVAALYPFEDAA